MDILIITNFTSTFSVADNDRFLYLAKTLCVNHKVEILTSDFCHEKKMHRNKSINNWPFKITFLGEPGYQKNVCLKRFYSHFVWGRNVIKYIQNRKKPDVVYCAVPSLTGPLFVSNYCKKNNVKFIIDVQDLWPEAFKMVFDIPLISSIIYCPFNMMANYIYKNADEVVAVSQTYLDRVFEVNKKCLNGTVVYLGTDLDTFDKNIVLPKKIKKVKGEIWLAYCGTLGSSYDLSCVFEALAIINKRGVIPPKFIVMGDGPLKRKFEAIATKQKIVAEFVGRLPYDEMCGLLKMCDIAINPIVKGAAQSIINKHADYAACGLPVVNTQESAEYKKLVNNYKFGINCRNGDSEDIANSILYLMENEHERKQKGINSRKCAEKLFDRKKSYQAIIKLFNKE